MHGETLKAVCRFFKKISSCQCSPFSKKNPIIRMAHRPN